MKNNFWMPIQPVSPVIFVVPPVKIPEEIVNLASKVITLINVIYIAPTSVQMVLTNIFNINARIKLKIIYYILNL